MACRRTLPFRPAICAGVTYASVVAPPAPAGILGSVEAGGRLAPVGVLVMVRSRGSIVMVPGRPCGAEASARPVRAKPAWPERSMLPPLPPCRPPRAVTVPSIRVAAVLSIVTRPPSPRRVASAETVAPRAMVVRLELPIMMVPPPVRPRAATRAVGASVVAALPAMAMLPPVWPSASTRPSITTEPPVPVISIWPGRVPVLARMVPPARTRFCTTPSAAWAVSCTVPPSARMVPVLVTSAVTGRPSGPMGACCT